MTPQDEINKWLGGHTEETKAFGYQCVAWAKQFCADMGYPIGAFGGSAINGWNTTSPFDSSWVRVEYTP